MQFQKGDRVMVRGLDMAFIVAHCFDDNLVQLLIEGESLFGMHSLIYARPHMLLLNNKENCIREGWIKERHD